MTDNIDAKIQRSTLAKTKKTLAQGMNANIDDRIQHSTLANANRPTVDSNNILIC